MSVNSSVSQRTAGEMIDVISDIQLIWDYMLMAEDAQPVHWGVVLGCGDLGVAETAAALWRSGYVERLAFTGGIAHVGDLADTGWGRPEADVLSEHAIACGVSDKCIVLERNAQNTGENFSLTSNLMAQLGENLGGKVIAISKPYMTRRAYATARIQWPGIEVCPQCEQISMVDYLSKHDPADKVVKLMIGDLHRIMEYPKLGFQTYQEVPRDVYAAFRRLVRAGYGEHMIGEAS